MKTATKQIEIEYELIEASIDKLNERMEFIDGDIDNLKNLITDASQEIRILGKQIQVHTSNISQKNVILKSLEEKLSTHKKRKLQIEREYDI